MKCQVCSKGFEPRHPRARFCSSRCRVLAWHGRRAKIQADREAKALSALSRAVEAIQEAREALAGKE